MQKVKIITAHDCNKLQEAVSDFIRNGNTIEQISYTTYTAGCNVHHNCMIIYHDSRQSGSRPAIEEIDVRR